MDNVVEALIEIPLHSKNKYEVDNATGKIKLDRVIYASMVYPTEYGIIENTLAPDGDPLDILVVSDYPSFPGCYVPARVLGYLEMTDGGKPDYKLISVVDCDPRYSDYYELEELPDFILKEIRNYTCDIVDEIKTGQGTFRHDNLTNKICPNCGKKLLAVNGKNAKMLVCQDRECGYKETLSRTTNARCPKCHKRMEMYVKGKEETFICACGYKEKLSAFQARRAKEGAGVNKRDVQKYMRQQQKEAKEPVNNAFAQALAGLKLE